MSAYQRGLGLVPVTRTGELKPGDNSGTTIALVIAGGVVLFAWSASRARRARSPVRGPDTSDIAARIRARGIDPRHYGLGPGRGY